MVEHQAEMPEDFRPVSVLSAGGTIAMTPRQDGGGAVPSLDAAALVQAVPGLAVDEVRTVRALPGVQLSLDDALAIARAAAGEAARGHGVVVTTGTDTLEELAALCDALHRPGGAPIVLTGAIRPASEPGADGPANLRDAVALARAAPAGGTYVAFGGEIHAAAEARKTDSTSPRAFSSPRTGPLGYAGEDRVTLHAAPPPPAGLDVRRLDFTVPIVPTYLGDDGALLRAALALPADALVLVALGAGHVAPAVLELLAAATVPVAATVRPERGALLHATYGFHGAEGDLRATGAIPAAGRSPQAARVRLLAALGAGLDRQTLRGVVESG
jgi:L-asparaginase